MKINEVFIKNLTVNATVIAATKYVDYHTCLELYTMGIDNFGENRADAFIEKYNQLQTYSITWHFIGKLQSNKVKNVINKIDFLHTLDRLSLAKEIEKHAQKKVKCFIEINDGEAQKDGVSYNDFNAFYQEVKQFSKIEVIGLMVMARENASDAELKATFIRVGALAKQHNLLCLSMGMSNDYQIALSCGATHIRLGRILFK